MMPPLPFRFFCATISNKARANITQHARKLGDFCTMTACTNIALITGSTPSFIRSKLRFFADGCLACVSLATFGRVSLGVLLLAISVLQACAPPRAATPNCGFVFPYERIGVHYVAVAADNAEALEFALWRRGYNVESTQVYTDPDEPIINEHFVYLHYSLRSTKTCLVDFAQRVLRKRVNVRMSSADEYRAGPVFYLVDTSIVIEAPKETAQTAQ